MGVSPSGADIDRYLRTGDSSVLSGDSGGSNTTTYAGGGRYGSARTPAGPGSADPANETSIPERLFRLLGIPLKGAAAVVAGVVSLLFGVWVLIKLVGYDDG